MQISLERETEVWYQWKIYVAEFNRLFDATTRNGEDYEFPVGDMYFESPEEADEMLTDLGYRAEAIEDKWVLARVETTAMPYVIAAVPAGSE